MTINRHIISPAPRVLLLLMAVILAAMPLRALDPDTYAAASRLSTGQWVKVRVQEAGLYRIPASTLRSWGFQNPAAVRVHGYGGARIPDRLSAENYIDDLPQVPSVNSAEGVTFYANGPETIIKVSDSYYHKQISPYTSFGYYFITEATDGGNTAAPTTGTPSDLTSAGTGMSLAQYEQDLVMATHVGPLLVGEDISRNRRLPVTLATPGRIAGTLHYECQLATKLSTTGRITLEVGGDSHTTTIGATAGNYNYGTLSVVRRPVEAAAGESLQAAITPALPPNTELGRLDYIAVMYPRALTVASGAAPLDFFSAADPAVGGATQGTEIWDVTDPATPLAVNAAVNGGVASWRPEFTGMRHYVAWNPDSRLAAPEFVGQVANQNLHATAGNPAMVIFTPRELLRQAERIADMHRESDGMEVLVTELDPVYNEFSSGAPDISGLRKFLKMIYDRGAAAGKPLRYALLMGRPTLDHRGIVRNSTSDYTSSPWWVVRNDRQSMSETDAFGTDDFLAMLADNEGESLGIDELSIAVGRIPATSPEEASELVDKLYQYNSSSKKTGWKNKMMFVADDEDAGVHVRQTEKMIAGMQATPGGQHMFNKVYIDAYAMVNGEFPQARREMFRALDEGVAWWYFVGHATNHSWTGENQLNFTDINNLYLRNLPFLVASTCNFLQWDHTEMSGGEIMYKEPQGGCIGMISATRPAYITDNGYLLEAFGRHNLVRDDEGRLMTAGEVYRRAKNDIRDSRGVHVSNSNRLRFVFMGDPALRLVTPDNVINVDAIDGRTLDPADQITIAAMANVTVSGHISAPDGSPLDSFDGVVSIEIYDAERSLATNGRGDGTIVAFDADGERLFAGSASVRGGRFDIKVSMPSVVADNFRPAAMSLYAYATNSDDEAVGVNRDFYVYGFEEPEQPDTEAPSIESFVLNHSGFTPGETVHPSPLAIAHVTDNVSINLSNAGVGQAMTLTLDDLTTYTDVALYYTPDPDGNPGGVINYPLENLTEGEHTLRLRVFDTSGNPSVAEIPFTVAQGLAPRIFDVYTDANPASTAANFYVRHDHPGMVTTVGVTVYDLMGRPVWTSSRRGMSDLGVSTPVTWDLTDEAGRRVQRGIYLYRASITADGEAYHTTSRRIAVTAP